MFFQAHSGFFNGQFGEWQKLVAFEYLEESGSWIFKFTEKKTCNVAQYVDKRNKFSEIWEKAIGRVMEPVKTMGRHFSVLLSYEGAYAIARKSYLPEILKWYLKTKPQTLFRILFDLDSETSYMKFLPEFAKPCSATFELAHTLFVLGFACKF